MKTKPMRVLPADVYDALELSAHVFGGIGGGHLYGRDGAPCCIHGHAHYVAGDPVAVSWPELTRVDGILVDALFGIGIDGGANDGAVNRILMKQNQFQRRNRVSFAEWCAELGVVRGES